MKYHSHGIVVLLILLLAFATFGCTPNPSVLSTPVPTPTRVSAASGARTGSGAAVSEAVGIVKGMIVPKQFARIAFGVSGLVTKIGASEGAQVKAGDLIAELDTKDALLQVQTAKDQLLVAQASLAQMKAPATKEEIDSAQKVYDSMVLALQSAQRGATKEELIALKANVDKAQMAVDQAQAVYDAYGGSNNPYVAMMPAALQLQQASLDLEIAQANYYKALNPSPSNIAQLQSSVAQAGENLRQKKQGPKPEDIAVAQARVQQAETAVEQANAELAKAKLLAPVDGTVNGLTLRVGEYAQAGQPIGAIVDTSELRIQTTELDEYGVTAVSAGQPVQVTVDALPGKTVRGTVLHIVSPQLPLSADSLTYTAVIRLDTLDPALRYGMTVGVEFVTP